MAAAVATVATSSLAHIPPVNPAPSAFTKLLHRSKFSSFDPQVKQVYSSHPASAHRGDFGFKRPLTLRRKNAHITVKSVDSRFQQTEWSLGDNQARFIRRFEELYVKPEARGRWKSRLGSIESSQWLVDSEFSDGEWVNGRKVSTTNEPQDQPAQGLATTATSLFDGGSESSGNVRQDKVASYNEHRTPEALAPNISSMSLPEFKRFLNKLRQSRPKFYEFLQSFPNLRGQSLHKIAQDEYTDYHVRFLQKQMQELLGKPVEAHEKSLAKEDVFHPVNRLIGQRPHKAAALDYTHISPLTTFFLTKPHLGLVLQKGTSPRLHHGRPGLGFEIHDVLQQNFENETTYHTSFAGADATLKISQASGKKPLLALDSEEGINPPETTHWADHYAQYSSQDMGRDPFPHQGRMRLIRSPVVEQAPRVVGGAPQGLKGARLALEVRVEGRVTEPPEVVKSDASLRNPYPPGTREYITNTPSNAAKSEPLNVARAILSRSSAQVLNHTQTKEASSEESTLVLRRLQNLLKSDG